MIQLKNLRVGNTVIYQISPRYKKRIATVISICTFPKVECTVDFGGKVPHTVSPEELYGIETTQELLEKINYLRTGDNFDYKHDKLRISLCGDNNYRMITYTQEDLYKEPICNFLHQIQNLHFFLSSEELKYTP